MVRSAIYCFLLVLAVLKDWQVTQHDFVTAFLNLPLDTEFYIELLPGIGKLSQVAKLLKIIYSLKQNFQLWFETLVYLFALLGFFQLSFEPFIFIGSYKGTYFIVAVYIDDLLIFGLQGSRALAELVRKLKDQFQLIYLGPVSHFLGIKVDKDLIKGCMHFNQQFYIKKLLKTF